MEQTYQPRIERFKPHYDRLERPEISWREVQERLLARDAEYLVQAERMKIRGVLFGFDESANPLIADQGNELALTGYDYSTARLVTFAEGYELFRGKDEVRKFETFTKLPFCQSGFASWLESGAELPVERLDWLNGTMPVASVAGEIIVRTDEDPVFVGKKLPGKWKHPYVGVRRLLRVKPV